MNQTDYVSPDQYIDELVKHRGWCAREVCRCLLFDWKTGRQHHSLRWLAYFAVLEEELARVCPLPW